MRLSRLTNAQIADAKIPAYAILIISAGIYIPGAALSHYWPLSPVLPGIHPSREYDWAELIVTLAVFGVLMRSTSMRWHNMMGAWLTGYRPATLATLYGILIYLSSFLYVLFAAIMRSLDGSLEPSDAITGSFAVKFSADGFIAAPVGAWLGGISAVLFVPFTEEIIFRGLLFRRLMAKMKPLIAVLLSSVIFASVHVDVAIVYPFVAGTLLALLYLKSGNLWSCIVAHGTANALSFFARGSVQFHYDDRYSVFGLRPTVIIFLATTMLWTALLATCLTALAGGKKPATPGGITGHLFNRCNNPDAGFQPPGR